MNPTKSIPAPATFAITENSSFDGFLVSLSTLMYSPNLKGTFPISLSSNNIFHIHDFNDCNDYYKSYPKIIAVYNYTQHKNSFRLGESYGKRELSLKFVSSSGNNLNTHGLNLLYHSYETKTRVKGTRTSNTPKD